MKDRRAHAAYFGYDFQIKAAIVIMLDNIEIAESLKIEGEEDIEIKLSDGCSILAQAKSVEDATDSSHAREKLKAALESLSEGATKVKAQQLILVTNSTNPFNDPESRGLFWGANRCSYRSLPRSSRQLIDKYLNSIEMPLDTDRFFVQRIPFSTDDEEERARATKERIRDFLGKIMVVTPGLETKLYDVWTTQLLFNGSVRDKAIDVKKESFIWPIIVYETDIMLLDEDAFGQFDGAIYEEITRHYHSIIDSHCEKYEFVCRVLCDYNNFKFSGRLNQKTWLFPTTCG